MNISADISRSGYPDQDDRGVDPRQATRQESRNEAAAPENDLFFELLEEMYSA